MRRQVCVLQDDNSNVVGFFAKHNRPATAGVCGVRAVLCRHCTKSSSFMPAVLMLLCFACCCGVSSFKHPDLWGVGSVNVQLRCVLGHKKMILQQAMVLLPASVGGSMFVLVALSFL